MKIYLAMAELEDGNRMFERAYRTYEAAKRAAEEMVLDVNKNTNWQVTPIIEDVELVDDE
jgi:hypothetical protein